MGKQDLLGAVQIGDGARHPGDAVVAAGGETQFFIGPANQVLTKD